MSGRSYRTLERDHRRLAEILRPGMSVLDVGCGTRAITEGIARKVAPAAVVGLDRDPDNLAVARGHQADLPNLLYQLGDALNLPFESRFDLVTAARTLQWIAEPGQTLVNMSKAAKPGGRVVVLDYNLADKCWEPDAPAEFALFYRAFLDWRAANHWDNHMADHLPDLFRAAGLTEVRVFVSDEIAARGDPGFAEAALVWTYVTETLGPRMIEAGFLAEDERVAAETAYQDWVRTGLDRQTLVMRTVEGVVP